MHICICVVFLVYLMIGILWVNNAVFLIRKQHHKGHIGLLFFSDNFHKTRYKFALWKNKQNYTLIVFNGLSETANYGVSMTTITIVDSLWRHNDNCCSANMRSQGRASCLLPLEFKCHLRYCSSQEVDVSLSHSAVLHYIIWTNAGIYLIGPLGTSFSEIVIEICIFPFKKMQLKLLSEKYQPF